MNLSNLSVKAKLGAGFGVLALVVLCVSALALKSLGSSHDDFQTYVEDDAARISLANDVLDAANARAISARNLVLVSSAADRESEKAAVTQAHAKLQDVIAKLKATLTKVGAATEQEKKSFADLERAEAKYGPVALGIVELALAGKRDEAVGRMNAECRPLLAALLQAANGYIATANAAAIEEVKASEARYAFARNLLLAICAASLAAATVLAWSITRSITGALGAEPAELGRTAERVAAGDLNPVAGAAQSPKGSVLASLGDMQSNLARVVGQVRAASDSIATGSAQIATGNADLLAAHRGAGLEPAADGGVDGAAQLDGEEQRRHGAPGHADGHLGQRRGAQGRRGGEPGGDHDGRHQRRLASASPTSSA